MKLSIGSKFGAVILVAILLVIAAGTAGLLGLQQIGQQTLRLADDAQTSQLANSLRFEIQQLRLDLYDGVARRDAASVRRQADQHVAVISRYSGELRTRLEARGNIEASKNLNFIRDAFESNVRDVIKLTEVQDWNAATLRLANQFPRTQQQTEDVVNAINDTLTRQVDASTKAVGTRLTSQVRQLLVIVGAALLLLGAVMGLLWKNLLRPVAALTGSATALAQGNLAVRTGISGRSDEIGSLAQAFDHMADQLEASHHTLSAQVAARTAELQAERESLEQALAELKTSTAERERLFTTLQQLQNPLVPILEGVLVAPIVGQLTSERLGQLQQSTLHGAAQACARVVLLDVTGVPMLDPDAARVLVGIGAGLRLLGATPILVGIRPEVAEGIVSAGVSLQGLQTAADLQRGVDMALTILGREIRPKR